MTNPARPTKPSGKTRRDRIRERPDLPPRAADTADFPPDLASTTGGGTGTPHAVPMPPSSGKAGAKKG